MKIVSTIFCLSIVISLAACAQSSNDNGGLNTIGHSLKVTGTSAGGKITLGIPSMDDDTGFRKEQEIDLATGDDRAAIYQKILTKLGEKTVFANASASSSILGDKLHLVGLAPLNVPLYLKIDDSGLTQPAPVQGLSAAEVADTQDHYRLSWTIPAGQSYDRILITRNLELLATSGGTETQYTDESGLKAGLIQNGRLLYHLIAEKDGVRSDVSAILARDPMKITTAGSQEMTTGTASTIDLKTGGNATGTVAWSILTGTLPPGVTLSDSTLTGTPTTAGTYSLLIQATDTDSNSDTSIISIKVSDPD